MPCYSHLGFVQKFNIARLSRPSAPTGHGTATFHDAGASYLTPHFIPFACRLRRQAVDASHSPLFCQQWGQKCLYSIRTALPCGNSGYVADINRCDFSDRLLNNPRRSRVPSRRPLPLVALQPRINQPPHQAGAPCNSTSAERNGRCRSRKTERQRRFEDLGRHA
jgi:hypothetical protein